MTHLPKVTVLVPSFNHGRYLKQRIESIFAQTHRNFEVVVIDDCSSDNSDNVIRNLLERYQFKYIRNERNSGTPFSAWEWIARNATGDYIWICESDDYADPGFLEITVRAMVQNRDAVIAYCDSWIVDEQEQKIDHTDSYFHGIWHSSRWDKEFVNSGSGELRDYQIYGQTVPNISSALFNTSAFRSAYSPFLKNFRLTGDWLFVGQIMRLGSVVYCKQTLNYFRRHGNTARVRVESARSQAEFMLTKYILFLKTNRPVHAFAPVMSTDAVRFLHEPASFRDVVTAMMRISLSHTVGCGIYLASSLLHNRDYLKKFRNRCQLIKRGTQI